MSLLASCTSRAVLPTELTLLAHSMMHTSASAHAAKKFGLKGGNTSQAPSRTRLVKSLKPKSSDGKYKGRLEVAPKRPDFVRDDAPHPESRDRFSEQDAIRRPRRNKGLPVRTFKQGEYRPSFKPTSIDKEERDRRRQKYRDAGSTSTTQEISESTAELLKTSGGLPQMQPRPPKVVNPLSDEFDLSSKSAPTNELPTEFVSPPLMEGLLSSVQTILGSKAKPTPIQALSLKHLFSPVKTDKDGQTRWRQYLLASETGSGKSMAYLLPMLQDLKQSELGPSPSDEPAPDTPSPKRAVNPRALVLAPTHELSRQLSSFAKALLHNIKLRVLCASRANVPSTTAKRNASASQMAASFDGDSAQGAEFVVSERGAASRQVDVLVGTPTKLLEMARGRGWDWETRLKRRQEEGKVEGIDIEELRRKWTVGEPEADLANVQWVVIDEADVLLDPDFQESTRMLLADIAAARGHPVNFQPELNLSVADEAAPEEVPNYPFNVLLTTATIPSSLASYLDKYHPSLTRLASPNLHKLPSTLKTEYESWTGGRKNKDVEKKIRRIWWEDAVASAKPGATISADATPTNAPKTRILVFCNKSVKVEELGAYLTEQGIPNVALTSTSDTRQRGNNNHLGGFLRTRDESPPETSDPSQPTF